MGFFDNLKSAKLTERGNYLEPNAEYVLEVVKTKQIRTDSKGDAFVVDFKVLSTTGTRHRVGEEVNWYQGMQSRPAMGAIKQFLYAVLGKAPDKPDPEVEDHIVTLAEEAISLNTLAGQKVKCKTVQIKTKEKGTDFTRHDFRPV